MKISSILHPVKLCRWYWRAADTRMNAIHIFNAAYRDELCWFGRIVVRVMIIIQGITL